MGEGNQPTDVRTWVSPDVFSSASTLTAVLQFSACWNQPQGVGKAAAHTGPRANPIRVSGDPAPGNSMVSGEPSGHQSGKRLLCGTASIPPSFTRVYFWGLHSAPFTCVSVCPYAKPAYIFDGTGRGIRPHCNFGELHLISGPRQGGRNKRQAQQLPKTCSSDRYSLSVPQTRAGRDRLRKDSPLRLFPPTRGGPDLS